MAIPCVSCGAAHDDSDRFCPSCGRPVGAPATPGRLGVGDNDTPTFEAVAPVRSPGTRLTPGGIGVTGATAAGGARSRLEPGTLLAGRYRIVALLGLGGMGEVYRADDLALNQSVALKFLPASMMADRERLERFRSEVSLARQVSHPNVCRVYDIGEADGLTFLSMEYIDGEDLASLLRRIGRLPSDKGVEIARQICAGLAAAHDRGVVHRDLKPANVMLDGAGEVRIADFGLAAVAGEALRAGTPAYMAPEQIAGGEATIRTDIYALGLVLYEIFTGKRAFVGSTVREFAALHRDRTPSSMTTLVADLDPAIERTIARCLVKDPASRPASALAVAAALPGGDPLAEAIARGETPSPELVAAAGSVGLVKPAHALTMLALFLAGLVAAVVLAGRLQPALAVPLPYSPDVLSNRAREVVRALGYRDTPTATSAGFETSPYLSGIQSDPWRRRWELMQRAQPPVVHFWYRQSPDTLMPWGLGTNRVSPGNPPETVPGMIGVLLDASRGRLHRFVAVPGRESAGAGSPKTPDWSPALRQAGLDLERLAPSTPYRTPPVYADARAAWDGTYPDGTDVRVHVEAAAFEGRLTYFELLEPKKSSPEAVASGTPVIQPILQVLVPILLLAMLGGAGLLAVRNLRMNRCDRRGAARIAVFLFVTALLSSLVGADYRPAFGLFLNVLVGAVSQGLLVAALAWTAYIALEPFARRRLPHALISWTRLVSGDWRDPLVARDLLIGATIGMCVIAGLEAAELFARGSIGGVGAVWPLDGFRFALTVLLDETSRGVLGTLSLFVLLLMLTVIVRRQWIAFVLIVLLMSAQNLAVSKDPVVGTIAFVSMSAVLVGAWWRFGLLVPVAALFAANVVTRLPVTFDFSAWYAASAYAGILVLVGLAAFGAWTSANLKTVVPRLLGEG